MRLLAAYAREAIRRGLIDEWHVWNFARTEEDRLWLRQTFPVVARIPGNHRYVRLGEMQGDGAASSFRVSVRCGHDFVLGLRPRDGGDCYEIVLGGWGNLRSVIRRLPAENALRIDSLPWLEGELLHDAETPGVLASAAWREVHLQIGADTVRVDVDGHAALRFAIPGLSPECDVFGLSGWGGHAELRMHGPPVAIKRFEAEGSYAVSGFGEFYHYYADRAPEYATAIFVKCDDDIVYIDLDRFDRFLEFRFGRPDYFVVSANVVNNGVCAFHQRSYGAYPRELMEFDGPITDFIMRQWADAEFTSALHETFVRDPGPFSRAPVDRVEWSERISINFISFLGLDLDHIGVNHDDDERHLSVTIPRRLGRRNAFFMPFNVAHLSFFPQEAGLDLGRVLGLYEGLAQARGIPLG
ncbi:MAG: hypothetical protein JO209_09995 [Acidisphaera sp.]|nr:hypothetical protein [Acidisphaera sp.]